MNKKQKLLILTFIFLIQLISIPAMAQTFVEQFNDMFDEVLVTALTISPGQHKDHFIPDQVATTKKIIGSLENFIGTSVSSFPLSSTVAGITFDFSSGVPVSTSSSLGPIFSERAQTIGSGRINIGFNFTHLNFTKLRGLPLEDFRMSFTHEDVGAPGLGDSPNEFDYIDFFPDMKINASIFAVFATFGVTDRFDIGVAIPFVNVHMKTSPRAIMNSFTYVSNDSANHYFGGTTTNPALSYNPEAIDDDATGLGDIALRAKYNFMRSDDIDLSMLLEYRMSTGDKDNFLGSGNSSFKIAVISSKIIGDFAPHFNVAYEVKSGNTDRNELEFIAGYDQKLGNSITMAVDFIGEFEMGSTIEALQFPDPVTVKGTPYTTAQEKVISLTNVPDFKSDNILNAAFGLKFSPKESIMIVGNVFIPLNDGGLRADFIPTVGFEFTF